jgi:hypothetical protein
VLLTKSFSPQQYQDALSSWEWLGCQRKTPVLASLFGDVFFQDPSGYWFLDSIEGTLTLNWDSRDAVQTCLDSPEGQDRYLLGGLAVAAERRGLVLGPKEVYDVTPPPILGGKLEADRLIKLDFVVALNIAGQIHNQVRDLAPGTRITGFTVDSSSVVKLSAE